MATTGSARPLKTAQPRVRLDRADRAGLMAVVAVALAAALFMLPALANERPFIWKDGSLYLALGELIAADDPADAIVELQNDPAVDASASAEERAFLLEGAASQLGARSVAYAVFLERGLALLSMWGVAALQCLFVAGVAWTALRLIWRRPPTLWETAALFGALAVVTPAGVLSALVAPDIFGAPMLVLIAVLFAAWPDLGRTGRILAGLGVGLCVLMHASHVLIAVAAAAACACVLALHRRSIRAVIAPSAAVVGTLVGALAVNAGLVAWAETELGVSLERPPFITAHVMDDGPGMTFIAEHCDERDYELCRYSERVASGHYLPGQSMVWPRRADLGGVYLVEDLDVRAKLRDEQIPFVIDVVTHYPLQEIAASIENFAKQLLLFRIDGPGSELSFSFSDYEDSVGWLAGEEMVAALPNADACRADRTERCGEIRFFHLRRLHYPVVALSALVIAAAGIGFMARHRLDVRRFDRVELFIVLLIAGVVMNALVCGVVAGPFDRYQSRVIWLLPALAGALLLYSRDKVDLREAWRVWRTGPLEAGARS